MANQLERGRIQVEAKDRHADDIRKDVELASVEADKILADQVDLDLKLKVSSGFHAMPCVGWMCCVIVTGESAAQYTAVFSFLEDARI